MSQANLLAVTDVSVVDVIAGAIRADQTVLIAGDTIRSVAPADDAPVPAGARVIDGRGLFLMPGLVDAHAHYFEHESFGRLYVANGVTLVRDMGMANDLVLPLRAALDAKTLFGPELRTAGTIVDGEPPLIPLISSGSATADEAREAVRRQGAAGADFVKVYSRLDEDAFRAAVEEAHALGLRVAGHVPDSVPIEDAAASGLDSCEHFFGFDKLIGRLLGAPVRSVYAGMGADVAFFLRWREIDRPLLSATLRSLKQSGLTVCPTIVTFKAGMQTRAFQSGTFPGSEYASRALVDAWQGLWADQGDLPAFIWQTWSALVVELYREGIPLLVGTDLSVPGILPGFSVHDEMEIWQDAGIPPADILRSATAIPAAWLGLDARLGDIATGKTASLVLVRANPLDDVRNARQIEAVIVRGRFLDRTALAGLLDESREPARR